MASSSAATESQAAQDQLAAAATSLGPRATALYKIYGEALGHTIKSIGYDHFASCFPTPAKYCPDSLRRVWAQMIGRFEELARVSATKTRRRSYLSRFVAGPRWLCWLSPLSPSLHENTGKSFLWGDFICEWSMVALRAASCHGACSHAKPARCSSRLAKTQGLPRPSSASLFLHFLDIGNYCRSCTPRLISKSTCIYQSEFEDILRERDAVRLLDGLDRLVVEASKRKQASESASGGAAIDIPIAYKQPPPPPPPPPFPFFLFSPMLVGNHRARPPRKVSPRRGGSNAMHTWSSFGPSYCP